MESQERHAKWLIGQMQKGRISRREFLGRLSPGRQLEWDQRLLFDLRLHGGELCASTLVLESMLPSHSLTLYCANT